MKVGESIVLLDCSSYDCGGSNIKALRSHPYERRRYVHHSEWNPAIDLLSKLRSSSKFVSRLWQVVRNRCRGVHYFGYLLSKKQIFQSALSGYRTCLPGRRRGRKRHREVMVWQSNRFSCFWRRTRNP